MYSCEFPSIYKKEIKMAEKQMHGIINTPYRIFEITASVYYKLVCLDIKHCIISKFSGWDKLNIQKNSNLINLS